jgi:exonuclease SbcC
LCGSLSHPSPANLTNVDSHLKQINEELKTLNSKKDLLKSGVLSLDSLNKQIISKEKNVETLFSDIESHSNKFVWEKYRDLSSEQIREIEQNEALLQREIAKLRDNESKVSKEYSSYLKRLTELENEINNIKTELAKYEGMSKPLTEKIDPYFKEKHSNNDTESLIKIRAQRNEEIEKRNQETEKRNKELNFLNQELVRLETILGNCEENLKKWKQEFEKYNNVLREAIAESEFENLAQVQAILNKNLNIATIRERIEQFSQQKTNLENSYNELLNKISDKEEPSIETINADKATLKESNDLLKSLLESKGKIEGEIKEFKDKLSEKQAVQERFDKLNIRLEGIKELDKMLKGDKFVQFISSIYLEQLCSKANERLRIISQNKFEIRNSEKNFEIIDYLNGAKSRSIKTLSGGQMFQASLCMALALVDTIRLNSNSNQEFFFIDEGFGTQDNECLDLIFESLKLLRQENKTVGLISHNENLKEKISGSITIELQQNKGSIIRTNYP